MRRIYGCVACIAALVVCGCAQSGRSWDDPVYQHSISASRLVDEHTAAGESVEQAPAVLDAAELTLGDAIRYAVANHPDLRSAGYAVQAAAGREEQAELYPNPTFAFGAEGLGASEGDAGETTYVIEQEIVLGSKLAKAQRVARAEQELVRAAFTAQKFELAKRVTHAFVTTVAAQERLAGREELLELAERLLDAAQAQVQAGAATEPDRLRAELVREQAAIELHSARFELDAAAGALAAAIGRPVDRALVHELGAVQIFGSEDDVASQVLRANSRVAAARVGIDRSRHVHALAKSQAIPNVVASAGPRYSDIDGESTVDVGIGIEIPLFDRNQGEVRAAFADRLAAAASLGSVELELAAETSAAWAEYESARLTVESYQESLLPKAERSLDLTRQAYQSGKVGYLRMLDAQQVYVESRIALVDALERLGLASADLDELMHNDGAWREPGNKENTDNEVMQ